jgi:hypothetical protein
MSVRDSALDPAALAYVRALMRPPQRRDAPWQALAAAAFAAVAALALATIMLTSPALVSDVPAKPPALYR